MARRLLAVHFARTRSGANEIQQPETFLRFFELPRAHLQQLRSLKSGSVALEDKQLQYGHYKKTKQKKKNPNNHNHERVWPEALPRKLPSRVLFLIDRLCCAIVLPQNGVQKKRPEWTVGQASTMLAES